MKDKIFGVLQRIGRSFMLPIAILPVAGLLLGIGSSFTNETMITTYGLERVLGAETVLHALLVIMNKVGSAVFDNLPLIFAVGVAIGMAKKEKEVSALSAVIAYFVMNTAINAMLLNSGQILDNGEISASVLEGTIASVCGIKTLQMGVFGGIIVGLGVAALHNRYHKISLPNALSFFAGSRFVPIISREGAAIFPLLTECRELCAADRNIDGKWFETVVEATGKVARRYPLYLKTDKARPADVSPIDVRILACLAEGLSMPKTAERLNMNFETLRSRIKELYRRLGAKNKTEAVMIAREMKII